LHYQKKIFLLIAISTAARVLIAISSELSNAEAYYWVYSSHLQWNYFDHPPMVAWLIRLTTGNLLFHNELFVRLGAILSSAICTYLIFKIGTLVNNIQTGWFAALLYTSSTYGSLAAGAFILPDSPQMVFWFSSILFLLKISRLPVYDSKFTRLWCLFGITMGLCIMSKVHGIFIWFGVAAYTIIFNRSWLKYPGIYLSLTITIIIASPILIWNLHNHFAGYEFHSGRISLSGASFRPALFIKGLLAVMLIINPINFFLIWYGIFRYYKGNFAVDKKVIQLILFCSLPLILLLLFISFFREIYPHWPGPAYSCLLLFPAIILSSIYKNKETIFPVIIKAALTITVILTISDFIITNYYPGTTSDQKTGLNIGKGDESLNMYGWREAGEKFDSLFKNDVAKGRMPSYAPIIVTNWFPASHIDFYIASITNQQTVGMGNISDLHQYYFMNDYKKKLKPGDNAYYLVPSNLFNYKTLDRLNGVFNQYEMPLVIDQVRNGSVCKEFYIFRMKGYKGLPFETNDK
jgi:hypothetical protein